MPGWPRARSWVLGLRPSQSDRLWGLCAISHTRMRPRFLLAARWVLIWLACCRLPLASESSRGSRSGPDSGATWCSPGARTPTPRATARPRCLRGGLPERKWARPGGSREPKPMRLWKSMGSPEGMTEAIASLKSTRRSETMGQTEAMGSGSPRPPAMAPVATPASERSMQAKQTSWRTMKSASDGASSSSSGYVWVGSELAPVCPVCVVAASRRARLAPVGPVACAHGAGEAHEVVRTHWVARGPIAAAQSPPPRPQLRWPEILRSPGAHHGGPRGRRSPRVRQRPRSRLRP